MFENNSPYSQKHPLRDQFPQFAGFVDTDRRSFYGKGYQDLKHRKPSIRTARKLLGWSPKIDLEKSVENTLDFFLRESLNARDLTSENSCHLKSEAVVP